MSKYLVIGSSSGIGTAVTERLRTQGHEVIGVALAGADIAADLVDFAARCAAVNEVQRCSQGADERDSVQLWGWGRGAKTLASAGLILRPSSSAKAQP